MDSSSYIHDGKQHGMRRFNLSVVLYSLLLLLPGGCPAQPTQAAELLPVMINEVLANEPGSAVSLEWVEVYNRSDATVDLSGYIFIDATDTTVLTGLALSPGEYLILARRLTGGPGQDSFESYWGNGSGTWGDAEIEDCAALTVPMKLRNSADTVELHGPGGAISVLFWDYGAEDGVSVERLRPDSPDEADAFLFSIDAGGSTPGEINSCTPRPNDLAIDSGGIEIVPYPPRESEKITITVPVENIGRGTSTENSLTFADDKDRDMVITEGEILSAVVIPILEEGQSAAVSYTGFLPGGIHQVMIALGDDGNPANNSTVVIFKVIFDRPEIVVNEYMPDPPPGGCEEWIELYNRSSGPVDLNGWRIGDSISQSVIAAETEPFPPGDFVIVCEDLAAFLMIYPDAGGFAVYEVGGWRALNNSGDRIVLLDDYGFVVDSLTFTTTYGGERSVERIDPDRPSGDVDNWWGSVDPNGATPGRANSTAVKYNDRLEISVSPNPFAGGQPVQIHYAVPFRTLLTAGVYDINGRKVKTLLEDRPSASGAIQWDGTDDNGKVLAPGIYVLFFETDAGMRKKIVLAVRPAE